MRSDAGKEHRQVLDLYFFAFGQGYRPGDDVFKSVAALSGGEKCRLALALRHQAVRTHHACGR